MAKHIKHFFCAFKGRYAEIRSLRHCRCLLARQPGVLRLSGCEGAVPRWPRRCMMLGRALLKLHDAGRSPMLLPPDGSEIACDDRARGATAARQMPSDRPGSLPIGCEDACAVERQAITACRLRAGRRSRCSRRLVEPARPLAGGKRRGRDPGRRAGCRLRALRRSRAATGDGLPE